MLLPNIITKIALFGVGLRGVAFADGQAEKAQLDVNGSIDVSNKIKEQKPKAPNLSLVESPSENLKAEARQTLKEAVDFALSSHFQNDILKHGSEDERKAFKEVLDKAITILSKDEKITKFSDYNDAYDNLDKASANMIFLFSNN